MFLWFLFSLRVLELFSLLQFLAFTYLYHIFIFLHHIYFQLSISYFLLFYISIIFIRFFYNYIFKVPYYQLHRRIRMKMTIWIVLNRPLCHSPLCGQPWLTSWLLDWCKNISYVLKFVYRQLSSFELQPLLFG